jgi:electron transfer flavoprotein beta subunit
VRIAVCWKWVSLDADLDPDARWSGVSPADEAALEVALTASDDVTLVTLGAADAEVGLRAGVAAGATRAVRVAADADLDAVTVASAVASAIGAVVADVDLVVCGDYSLDRGTGSFPAFLAAELGASQALGLVGVDTASTPIVGVRRLDGGRREILEIRTPAVVSVEGSVASLRRAPLARTLEAGRADVHVVPGPPGCGPDVSVHPFRPRPRTVAVPAGDTLDRVRAILDVGGDDIHADTVVLDSDAAAQRILAQLREWGYLGAEDG